MLHKFCYKYDENPPSFFTINPRKTRLLVALAGIGFADILMFMQLGFKNALFDSSVRLHNSLQGDIFILNSNSDTFTKLTSFSQRRLYETLAVDTVESVTPVYIGLASWKNPKKRQRKNGFYHGN